MSPGALISNADEIGRVAPRIALRGRRSGPPESRPQLESFEPRDGRAPQARASRGEGWVELRSGEWVTEPAARGGRGDRTRPPRALWRVRIEFCEAH
jgi:hypothetical protein